MTRIPELEQALVAAGHRRYGRPRWRRAVAPAVAALAVAAIVVVALSLGSSEREVPAVADPAPLNLPAGEPLTEAQRVELESRGVADLSRAFSITGPKVLFAEGARKEWLVVPEEGQVCVLMSFTEACASAAEFAERGVFTYAEQPERSLGGGTLGAAVEVQALLPPDAKAVVLAQNDTVQIATVDVADRTYSARAGGEFPYRLTLRRRHGIEIVIHEDPDFGEAPVFGQRG